MSEISNVKLICMDMDGTLFASGEKVPKINRLALGECEKRGIHLALVSGRNYRFLSENARAISNNIAVVSANGARIDERPGGKCVFEGVFDPSEARRVSDVMWSTGAYYEIYTGTTNFAFRYDAIPPVHKKSLERYIRNGQILGCEFPTGPRYADYNGIYKFVAFSDNPTEIEKIRSILDANNIPHSSSGAQNVETMAPGVGKGRALEMLAKHFNVDICDTMAFGDYTNDCDMLSACGHPVAMANGVQELKRIAELIAPPNTEGGVGKVIFEKVLNMPIPDITGEADD